MQLEKIVATFIIVVLTLQAGLQVHRLRLISVEYVRLLAQALLANIVVVPILTVLVVRALRLDQLVAAGILLMAIAPGVPFLPFSAGRRVGGNEAFAIVLTFFLPLVSVVSAPITARLVFPPALAPHIPVGSLMATLVVAQLVPLLAGMLIVKRAPGWAARLDRPLFVLLVAAIVLLFVLVAPLLIKAFISIYGSFALIAAIVTVSLCGAVGYLLGGPRTPNGRTLAIATTLRNVGLALLVATTDFPGTIVSAVVLGYFIVQFASVTVLRRVFTRGGKPSSEPAR